MSGQPDGTLETVLAAAAGATAALAGTSPGERADWLRAIADGLEADRDGLVALAGVETNLPEARLGGELTRTAFQLRLTADALVEGSWLEATIDHPDAEWPPGPRPDLRRMLRPIGPVLVVAASNFPFAFSVAGGDTANALGAGCAVVLKAHPGHRELSRRTAQIVSDALAAAGAPAGAFGLIESEADTQNALRDPRIMAGAFTGSVRGGRALYDIAAARPIPFYGELGSVNPAFVLPGALAARRAETVAGFVGSFTLGVGQFCTKPGILFVPRTDGLVAEIAAQAAAVAPAKMLNERIVSGLEGRLGEMRGRWTSVQEGSIGPDGVSPSLFSTTIDEARAHLDALFDEAFGPAAVIVEYDDPAEVVAIAHAVPGQLTATIHGEESDAVAAELVQALAARAGRIVWNGWPTGVAVSWAMQHGGPWPSTTASLHTSVGPTGLRRFVAPVSYQDVPASLLPPEIREDNPLGIWQRIDGRLTPPGAPVSR